MERTPEPRKSANPAYPALRRARRSAAVSLDARSRFTADITNPPANPIRITTKDIAAAASGEKGVTLYSAAPTSVAETTPPARPSHVLLGLTRGAISGDLTFSPHVLENVAQFHDH